MTFTTTSDLRVSCPPEHLDDIDERFALIRPKDSDIPAVTFHDLRQDSRLLSSVYGYAYSNGTDGAQSRVGRYVSRAVSKLSCLSEQMTRCRMASKSMNGEKDHRFLPAAVQVGPDAFISQFTTENNKDVTNTFPRLSFRYPNGLSTSYYIHARNTKSLERFNLQSGSVCFSTGMCLFSESLITSSRDRDDAATQAGWTLYELETMTKLSSIIADVVGLLMVDDGPGTPLVNIYIDLPDVQYYWRAFELLQQGEITEANALSWVAAVDTRKSQIWLHFRDLLQDMLDGRELAPVQVFLAEGSTSFRELLMRRLKAGQLPSVEECVSNLRTEGPNASLWNEYMDQMPTPSDTDSLNHLIHVFNTVKPVLSGYQSMETNVEYSTPCQPPLLIVVDNIDEWDIFDGAKSHLQKRCTQSHKHTEVPIIGLFPMQRIFVEDHQRSSLWAKCPGTHLGNHENDSLWTPTEVVEKIYGQPKVKRAEGTRSYV